MGWTLRWCEEGSPVFGSTDICVVDMAIPMDRSAPVVLRQSNAWSTSRWQLPRTLGMQAFELKYSKCKGRSKRSMRTSRLSRGTIDA